LPTQDIEVIVYTVAWNLDLFCLIKILYIFILFLYVEKFSMQCKRVNMSAASTSPPPHHRIRRAARRRVLV
jgi:hypothetical protein